MSSKYAIGIKDNNISYCNSSFNGPVSIIYSEKRKTKKENLWFQMKDPTSTFSGRQTELEDVHSVLSKNKTLIIYGLPGIGKTELCRYYACKYCHLYHKNIVWINSEDADKMKESIWKLAAYLDTPLNTNSLSREEVSVIQDIYRYFENQSCLFIFDNVVSRKDIADYLPSKELKLNIFVLITSQTAEWGKLKAIELRELPKRDALELMAKCLKDILNINEEMDSIEELADLMQCLPLALQQAAAYIEDMSYTNRDDASVRRYVQKFKEEESVLDYRFDGAPFPHYSEHDYNKTVYINISLTLKKLREQRDELALDILCLIAYFAPDYIMTKTFKPLLADGDDTNRVREAIRILRRHSLVTTDHKRLDEFHIHRLAQSVVRQQLEHEGLEKRFLIKALNLSLVKEEKFSIHTSAVLRHAHKKNLLYEYYDICQNKELFWFCLVCMQPTDVAYNMLQSAIAVSFLKDNDIMSAAVTTNNVEIIGLVLERGASANEANTWGETPLTLAVSYANLNVVKFLVDHGADPNKTNCFDNAPLTIAVTRHKNDILLYLIEAGADLHTPNHNALHEAAGAGFVDVMKILVDSGVHVEAEYLSKTPLEWAKEKGQSEAVHFLLNAGAIDRNLFNNAKESIYIWKYNAVTTFVPKHRYLPSIFWKFFWNHELDLIYAAFYGHLRKLRQLLAKGYSFGRECGGNTLFHFAVVGNQLDIIKYLTSTSLSCNEMNDNKDTPLILAAAKGNAQILKHLCKFGADPGIYERFENSPIFVSINSKQSEIAMYLAMNGANISDKTSFGNTLMHAACYAGLLEVVEYLRERGLPITDSNNLGYTPLHLAAIKNEVPIIHYLIKQGADVNKANNEGETAVLLASRNSLEAVSCLVRSNANVNLISNSGVSPLHIASSMGHKDIAEFLLEHGADIYYKDRRGCTCLFYAAFNGHLEIIEYLAMRDMDLQQKSLQSSTLLHYASANGKLKVVKYLLRNGANVNERNDLGQSALMFACCKQHFKVVEYLLNEGARVNDKNPNGNTPFEFAAAIGNVAILKLLVSHGADIFSEDKESDTALHEACRNGHLEVVQYLCAQGSHINKTNSDGYTPLDLAYKHNHYSIVHFLVTKYDAHGFFQ